MRFVFKIICEEEKLVGDGMPDLNKIIREGKDWPGEIIMGDSIRKI